jgi:hypothetical protein
MKPVATAFFLVFALSIVAACSGGGSIPSSAGFAGAGSGAAAAPSKKRRAGKARIRIRIPHKKRHGKHGRYISPSTKSISITVGNAQPIVANLTPASPNCEVVASYTQCTIVVEAPFGTVNFSFATYDLVGAAGNKLSANTVTEDVVSGATTPLNVTLGGIAKSISMTPSITAPAVTGSQAAGYTMYGNVVHSFTVVPLDADGNDIIGPGAPSVSVTAPPAAQKLGVATPAPATPNQWGLISAYAPTNPLTPLAATVTASVTPVPGSGGSAVSAPVAFTLYQPWVYVTDYSDDTLYVFDERGDEIDLGPNAWVGIPSPGGISYDPHNQQLYMAGVGDNVVYQTDVLGNLVAPSPGAWANMSEPVGALYVPSNNHIYVPNDSATNAPDTITAYDETGAQQTVSGAMSTQYGTGLAYNSANGFIYLAGGGQTVPAVLAYDVNGNQKTLSGTFGNLVQADALGYDSNNGFFYVGSIPISNVSVYDAQGNVQTTTGTFPGLSSPNGILYDPYDGDIYVADGGTGNGAGSGVFAFDEQGNALPITFNETFNRAYGITVVP